MGGTPAERAAGEELARRLEGVTRVVLRPVASPLALGFLALAAATFVLAGLQLGWVEQAEGHKAALVILAFTVPLQFLASVIGFLARDGIAATGMGLLSGIWLAVSLVMLSSPPGSKSDALGMFLLMGGVAMWVPGLNSFSAKVVPALVLSTAGLRFFLGGLHQLTGDETWENVAGVVGLALAGLAVYAAFAVELEDTHKREVLPLGRRGKAKEASEGGLFEQLKELDSEPGVKKQL
jgi:uncharacterized protein